MKRILFFVIVLAGYYADGQTLPTKNTTPTEFRELVADSLGLPVDTFSVPTHYNMRLRPWIAAKGDSIYLWSIAQQKWVLNTGGGGGGGSVSSVFGRTGVITAEIGDYSAFYVPLSRTINGYVLSSNVSLTKSDIGLSNVPNIDATARANHTGTQLASTISDFTTAGRNLFSAGTGISYNATTGVISSTGTTSVAWGSVTGSLTDQTDLTSALALKEALANKATSLGTLNNTLYPTTQAVANYVTGLGYTSISGTGIVKSSGGTISYLTDNSGNWNTAFGWGNHASAGYELQSNKSTSTTLGTSNTLYPSQLAVKTYVDNAVSGSAPALTQYRIGIGNASNLLSSAPAITGSRALVSDANGVPTHASTTAAQINYLSTTTSDVQAQINKNIDSIRKRYLNVRAINDTMWALQKWNGTATTEDTVVISLANGDKGDITVNNGWQNLTIDNGAVTNAKVASGIDAAKIADGSVSSTEFQYLNSVTSNVQTQIDSKQATLVSGTNIKTINGNSLVGSGNVSIAGNLSGLFKRLRFTIDSTTGTGAPVAGQDTLNLSSLLPTGMHLQYNREFSHEHDSVSYWWNASTRVLRVYPPWSTAEHNELVFTPDSIWSELAFAAPAGYDADAQTVITAIEATDAGTLTTGQRTAINNRILAIKAQGKWTDLVAYYGYVGGTASSDAINWKSPGTYNVTWSGTVTHNSTGVQFDGSTGYGNTGINDNTVLNLDAVTIGAYSRTSTNNGFAMGLLSTNGIYLADRNSMIIRLHDALDLTSAMTPTKTLMATRQTAAPKVAEYRNGTQLTVDAGAAVGKISGNIFIGAINNLGLPGAAGFSDKSYGSHFIFNVGFTSAEAAQFATDEQAFQTALGRAL
jgi:hypothetical protein